MSEIERDLRSAYPDFLAGHDPGMLRLVHHLDAGYTRTPLPARACVPPHLSGPHMVSEPASPRAGAAQRRRWLGTRRTGRRRAHWLLRPAVLLAALVTVTVVLAAGSRINLGKPTNDLPSSYLPIGGFHHTSITLQQNGKPVVLLMGTAIDFQTAVVRWPLVKALTQFGSFVGAKPAQQACHYPLLYRHVPPGHYGIQDREPCGPPTFDLTKASYRSAYVAFREINLFDQNNKVHVNALSPVERRLYDTYARSHVSNSEAENIAASVMGKAYPPSSRRLPLLLIGQYVQTVEQNLYTGDFEVDYGPAPVSEDDLIGYLSFQQVQSGLQVGKIPSKMGNVLYYGDGMLIHAVNIDANLFTALICHADGGRPRSVCSRPVIRQLLRHVK